MPAEQHSVDNEEEQQKLPPTGVKVISYNELINLRRIDEGGFGIVFKGKHLTFGDIAYKQLKAQIIRKEDRFAQDLKREAQMTDLHHPNITILLAITFEEQYYGCVFEYAKYGNLSDFIGRFKGIAVPMKLSIAEGVIHGMNYLHSRSDPVIHGDLKLHNILISYDLTAKICDFGLAKWKQFSTERTQSQSVRGTATHIPPENWEDINRARTVKFDIYSFSILLWELISEKRPFENASVKRQISEAVKDRQRPDMKDWSENDVATQFARKYVTLCWDQEPSRRPSFADLEKEFGIFLKGNEKAVIMAFKKLQQDVTAAAMRKLGPLRVYAERPQLKGRLKMSKRLSAIAHLDDKIFVVFSESNLIQVYDSNTGYRRLEDIRIDGLRQPSDIVACLETKRLYIADFLLSCDSDCIWQVSLDSGSKVVKFLPNNLAPMPIHPRSLSMAKRRLLMTAHNELVLFGLEGLERRRIRLSHDMNVHHAVETRTGTFIICHSTTTSGTGEAQQLHQISEIDGDGRMLCACEQQVLPPLVGPLTWPRYLVLDSHGRVFAADYDHRVVLLSAKLEVERILVDMEQQDCIERPNRLCFAPKFGLLLIGTSFSVQMFGIH